MIPRGLLYVNTSVFSAHTGSPVSARWIWFAASSVTRRRGAQPLGRRHGTHAAQAGKLGITPWMKLQGGMFLWMRLPHGLDSARVSQEALHEGVVLAPGNVFSLSQTATPFLRSQRGAVSVTEDF